MTDPHYVYDLSIIIDDSLACGPSMILPTRPGRIKQNTGLQNVCFSAVQVDDPLQVNKFYRVVQLGMGLACNRQQNQKYLIVQIPGPFLVCCGVFVNLVLET